MSPAAGQDRHLDWPGCYNTRELGGLPLTRGGRTRPGALVRSDSVHRLTPAGWRALWDHGVRTVIDLRNPDELEEDVAPRPPGLTTLHLPYARLESGLRQSAREAGLRGTPLSFRPFLERFPERTARVVGAFARAEPGGVLVHCVVGRDRTGLISLLMLALAGVEPAEIALDYVLSGPRLAPLHAAVGESDQQLRLDAALAAVDTTATAVVTSALQGFDPRAHLHDGGLDEATVAAAARRLTS